MTKDEILSMDAGPEIDGLVAEKVMGLELVGQWEQVSYRSGNDFCHEGFWPLFETGYINWAKDRESEILSRSGRAYHGYWGAGEFHHIPEYSTDIANAFEVVERVRSLTGCFELISPTVSLAWSAGFWIGRRAEADTAPLAICRAALLATASTEPQSTAEPTKGPA